MNSFNRIFIIAEAGVNHNGSLRLAKKMIDAACIAGADAVKFQTFKAENLASKGSPCADYQRQGGSGESQFAMLKRLELDEGKHKELISYSRKKKIMFLSTPFDLESADFLNRLGLKIFKISSGEITNLPLLRKISSFKKKIIISTGMSCLKEIKDALSILVSCGTKKKNITVLHCNSGYPTPPEDVNLKAMLAIRDKLKVNIGYSDHTLGIEAAIAAAALGARVIEKHFTLDRNMRGPDQKASIEPWQLKQMVDCIRSVEKAMGSGIKAPSLSELGNLSIARKSIVAKVNIAKGTVFSEKNITVKRPGSGISPMLWDRVIGRSAKKDFKEDELIRA